MEILGDRGSTAKPPRMKNTERLGGWG